MRDEFAEPVKVAGKHRIIGGACVDCGKPLAAVCDPFPDSGNEPGRWHLTHILEVEP